MADTASRVLVLLLRDFYLPWSSIPSMASVSRSFKSVCYCDQIFRPLGRASGNSKDDDAEAIGDGNLTFTGIREQWILSFTQHWRPLYRKFHNIKQLQDLIQLDAGSGEMIQKSATISHSLSTLSLQTSLSNASPSATASLSSGNMNSPVDIAGNLAAMYTIQRMGFLEAADDKQRKQIKFNISTTINYYRDLLLGRFDQLLMVRRQRHHDQPHSDEDEDDEDERLRQKRRDSQHRIDNSLKSCVSASLILPYSLELLQEILDSFMMDRLQAVIPRQLKSADDNNNSGNGNQQLLSVDAYRQFWSDLTIVMDELVAKLQKIIPRSALCRQLTRLLECAVQSVLLTVLSPVLSTGRQQRQQHHNQQSFSNTLNNRRDKNQMFQFLDVLTLCIQQWSRLLDLISESSEQSTGFPIGKGTRRKLTLTIFGELHAEYIELEIQGFRTALADIPIHPKTIASANILMELINNENDIMTKIRFYFMDKTKQALKNKDNPSLTADVDSNFSEFTWPKSCLQILGYFQRSMNRSALISGNEQTPIIASRLNTSLLKEVLAKHYMPIFEECFNIIGKCKVQDEGDDDARVIALFLETVYFADLVHQMIDNYMHDCLQGLIDMQDSFTEFAREKKSFEKGIDDLVAKGLESCINIVLERIQITMQADHKPNDYNFKAMKPNMEPTEACRAVITTVEMYSKLISRLVDKSIHQVFITELGTRLFQTIIKNMKKFVVSPAGGLQVITDFNYYYSWAARYQMQNNDLRDLYAVLKQLGNMYIVDPAGLRDLIHEQQVARFHEIIKTEELLELVALRSDWQKIKGTVEASECVIS